MEMPAHSPYRSATVGIDQAAVVRGCLSRGLPAAFAGDGFPDAEPVRLVPAELRFARGDLADVLRADRLPFRPFDAWSDIARVLLGEGG